MQTCTCCLRAAVENCYFCSECARWLGEKPPEYRPFSSPDPKLGYTLVTDLSIEELRTLLATLDESYVEHRKDNILLAGRRWHGRWNSVNESLIIYHHPKKESQ